MSQLKEMRDAFEKWAKDALPDALLQWSDAHDGYYLGIESNAAWKTWKRLVVKHEMVSSVLSEENRKLRRLLFIAHGSDEHYLYGDDGEQSCNTCKIDFNRDSADEIEQKIYAYNMRKISQALEDGEPNAA
jgi:hypothetical protein